MPSRKRRTCQRKALSVCVITCFVLFAGMMIFVVAYVTFNWQDIIGESSTHGNSSDIMYEDCRSKAIVVTDKTLMHRWEFSLNFTQAWSDAEKNAREPAHTYMEKHHSVAIYMYTQPASQDFETTDKTGQHLMETFESRSFFFTLSEALQVLKHSQVTCVSTNYRTDSALNLTISNKHIRFSTFILGTDDWNFTTNASCFEVYTCFGADITHYSALKLKTQVLIPPYEVFKMTDIQTDAQRCKVTYRLKSNLNCVYDEDSNMLYPTSALPVEGLMLILSIICIIIVSLLLPFVILKVLEYHKITTIYRASLLNNRIYNPRGAVIQSVGYS